MTDEQDSYEEYKKYLEDSLGIYGISPPPKPLSPYMRFYFERHAEEKSKGNQNMIQLSKVIAEEWKALTEKKKDYYQKTYEVRNRERDELQEEYDLLTKKKKPVSGYARYYKMRYKEINKENPKLDIQSIGRMATTDWKNLSSTQREKFNKEAADEQARKEFTKEEREKKIEEYNERVRRFQDEIKEEKVKILKKFGVFNKKEQKLLEKRKQREAKQLLKYQEKKAREEEKLKKKREALEAKRKQKEEEKKKKDEERLTHKKKVTKEVKPKVEKKVVEPKEESKPKPKPKAKVPAKKAAKPAAKKGGKGKGTPKAPKASPAKKTKPIKKSKTGPKRRAAPKQEVKKELVEEASPAKAVAKKGGRGRKGKK